MTHSLVSRESLKTVNIADRPGLWPPAWPWSTGMSGGRCRSAPAPSPRPWRAATVIVRYARRAAHPRRQPGRRLVRARVRHRAGPAVADGQLCGASPAATWRKSSGRRRWISDRESRQLRLRRIAENAYVTLPAAGSRGVRRVHARRQPVHRHASEQSAGGVHVARLSAPAVERGRFPADLPPHVPRPHHHLATTRSSSATCWRDGDAAKVNFLFPLTRRRRVPARDRTAGPSRAAAPLPASRCSRTICTWSIRCPASGTWPTWRLPAWMFPGSRCPGVPGVIVGHNQRIAWGITNLQFDVQDLYIEKMDDARPVPFPRPGGTGARGARDHPREGPGGRGNDDLGDAPRPDLFSRTAVRRMALRWTAAEPGCCSIRFWISTARRTGRSSPRRLRALAGPGIEFRLCRRGRQHRLSRRRRAAQAPRLSRATCRWMARPAISNGTAIFRSTSCRASTIRPSGIIATANQNPFPADFPYPVNGNFATARPRSADSRAAFRAQRMARRGHAGRADRHLFGVQQISGRTSGGGLREAQRHESRAWTPRWPAAQLERPDG